MAHKRVGEDWLDKHMPRPRVDKKLVDELKADDGSSPQPPAATPLDDGQPVAPAPVEPPPAATPPPVEPVPPAPAGAPPPATPPPVTAPPTVQVPLHVHVDTKAALKAAETRNAELQARLEEATKPKPPPPVEPPPDPEPNMQTHPVEHDQWMIRKLNRENEALGKRVEAVETSYKTRNEQEAQVRAEGDFIQIVDTIAEKSRTGQLVDLTTGAPIAAIPDINERREFLRKQLVDENLDSGYDEATSRQLAHNQELAYYADCARRHVNPILALSRLADRRGYRAASAAPAAARPAADATTRIQDAARRQEAGRTASVFPGAPPPSAKDTEMTAQKWVDMSPAEKRAWRKAHPDVRGPMAAQFLDDSRV